MICLQVFWGAYFVFSINKNGNFWNKKQYRQNMHVLLLQRHTHWTEASCKQAKATTRNREKRETQNKQYKVYIKLYIHHASVVKSLLWRNTNTGPRSYRPHLLCLHDKISVCPDVCVLHFLSTTYHRSELSSSQHSQNKLFAITIPNKTVVFFILICLKQGISS